MRQSNCSLHSEQPKSVVHAWPMVNLWNFSMSMTPTWATAQPNSSGRWFTQAAGGGESTQIQTLLTAVRFEDSNCLKCVNVEDNTPTSRPPLEPPFMVSLDGDVYPSLMRYSAAHWKSVKQFCLFASMPARQKNIPEWAICVGLISHDPNKSTDPFVGLSTVFFELSCSGV